MEVSPDNETEYIDDKLAKLDEKLVNQTAAMNQQMESDVGRLSEGAGGAAEGAASPIAAAPNYDPGRGGTGAYPGAEEEGAGGYRPGVHQHPGVRHGVNAGPGVHV